MTRTSTSGETTLLALPLAPGAPGGAPTPVVSFSQGQWNLRADGGAVAVGAWTGHGARIAIWDVRSGTARWLTPDEPGTTDSSPLWSSDGAYIYYASSSDSRKGTGVFQISIDGSGKRQVLAPGERTGPPLGLTPDGRGLVWSRVQAGGSVEIVDIATGVNRHIEDVASVVSWRARQPRALLIVGACCAGKPGGSLVAFDDVAMTSRVVAERGPYGDPAWGVGSWDPTGTRVATVKFDNASPYDGALVIIDTESGASQPIADTRGAANVLWLSEGIVFQRPLRPGSELVLLPSGGGPAISLYQDAAPFWVVDVVRP